MLSWQQELCRCTKQFFLFIHLKNGATKVAKRVCLKNEGDKEFVRSNFEMKIRGNINETFPIPGYQTFLRLVVKRNSKNWGHGTLLFSLHKMERKKLTLSKWQCLYTLFPPSLKGLMSRSALPQHPKFFTVI